MKSICSSARVAKSASKMLLCSLLMASVSLAAQPWKPTKGVELVVPSGAGAALDAAARELVNLATANKLIDKSMIVTNKSGGGGTLAIQTMLQHPGDAHWLTVFSTGMLNVRAIGTASATYESLTPVAVFLEEAVVTAVRADSPLKSGADLVNKLKADSQSVSIGVATSVGNHIHTGVAKPLSVAGVDVGNLRVIPFKSSAESMNALLGGHLDAVAATTPNVISHIKAGRIRVLGVATPERLASPLDTVPTWTEQGIPAVHSSVQGILGPKGMTAEQQAYWQDLFMKVCSSDDWKRFLAKQNWRPMCLDAKEFASYLDKEYPATKALLTQLKISAK